MKFVIENLVRLLVTAFAAALVLTSIYAFLLPVMGDLLPDVFGRKETNLDVVVASETKPNIGPELTCIEMPVMVQQGSTVDLFNPVNITAKSSSGENLINQLTLDYAKDVDYRDHVFIYKVNADNSYTLTSSINTSKPGKWVVVYLVTDEFGSDSSKITYVVN